MKEYTYNHAGQLSAVSVGGTVTDTYTYNAAGALSTHNGKTYTYDAWDRLSGYTDGTASYTYKYDTDGLRTQKNDTQYVVDIHNNVIAEANESGSVTAETIWGHRPLARKTGDDWYYYLYNAHGDVIGLTDESGTVVNSYAYSPWGEIRTQTESVKNPIKYAGEYYDDELDMLYLRARYYDPQTGRFISLDAEKGSIQNPMDMNRYVYCRNNPLKYVDPSGKEGVAAQLLFDAFTGKGASKDYSSNQGMVRTFYFSGILNNKISELLKDFKKSGYLSKTYQDSISFYGNDTNINDLDLHLGVGLANYIMIFTKSTVKRRFLWKTWEETVYSVTVRISDTYNFDQYREGKSISNWLNNWGYDMQKNGNLTPFYWSITFEKKGI